MTQPAPLKPRHLQLATGPLPYTEFTEDVEAALVFHASADDAFWLAIGQHIDGDSLRSEPAKLLLQAARQLASVGAPLTHTATIGKLQERVHKGMMDQSDMDALEDWLDGVDDNPRGLPEQAALVELAAPVLRQRQRAALIQELTNRNSTGRDLGDLPTLLAATEDIGKPQAHDFAGLGDGVWSMFERLRRGERLKLGNAVLDDVMGGMPRGSLLTIGGDPGDGKSVMLVDIACHNLLQGRRVIYVTMEMGTAQTLLRIVANLTGEPEDSVSAGSVQAKAKFNRLVDSGLVAPFAICYLPQGSTLPMLHAAIEQVRKRDPRFADGWDALVVDYGDLMGGDPNDRNSYEEAKTIWKGLRQLAVDHHNWTITASQLRDANDRKGTVYDFADSKHKGRITDSGLIISRDKDVDSERYIKVAKHRDGRAGDLIGPFVPDFARAKFSPEFGDQDADW